MFFKFHVFNKTTTFKENRRRKKTYKSIKTFWNCFRSSSFSLLFHDLSLFVYAIPRLGQRAVRGSWYTLYSGVAPGASSPGRFAPRLEKSKKILQKLRKAQEKFEKSLVVPLFSLVFLGPCDPLIAIYHDPLSALETRSSKIRSLQCVYTLSYVVFPVLFPAFLGFSQFSFILILVFFPSFFCSQFVSCFFFVSRFCFYNCFLIVL